MNILKLLAVTLFVGVSFLVGGNTALASSSFTSGAVPSTPVNIGTTGTATWGTSGASSVKFVCSGPAASSWGATGLSVSGSRSVTATSGMVGTTSCTVTANAVSGTSATVVFTWTVNPAASFSTASFSPGTVAIGGSSTASWTTSNASSVSISCSGPAASSWNGSYGANSSKTVTATSGMVGTTNCSATAIGAGGNSSPAPFTWTVTAPPASFATASFSPASVGIGGSSTASWTTSNATSVSISCSGPAAASWNGSYGANSSKTVTATSGMVGTTSCNATAIGSGGNSSPAPFTWVVTSTPPASFATASFSPGTVGIGGSSTASWTTSDASSVSISCSGPAAASWNGSYGANSSKTVTATSGMIGTTSCNATAIGAGGNSSPAAFTWVVTAPPATFATATFIPDTVGVGGSTTATWTTSDATSITISCSGPGASAWNGSFGANSSKTVTATSGMIGTTSCNAVAVGPGGNSAPGAFTWTVTAAVPAAFATATFTPDTVLVGGATTATWTTTNATSITISCSGPGAAAWNGSYGANSSKSVTATAGMLGVTNCTATAIGAGGNSAPGPFVWTVTNGPATFATGTFTPDKVKVGSATTATWTTTNATSVTIACSGPGAAAWNGSYGANSSKTVTGTAGMVGTTSCNATAIGAGGNSSPIPFNWVVTTNNVFTITTTVGPNGTLTPAGVVYVVSGDSQAFTATPNGSYRIASVLFDGTDLGLAPPGPLNGTVTNVIANHTLNVTFTPSSNYIVNASATSGGTITPSGSLIAAPGSSKSFTVTPDVGYAISAVFLDGLNIGTPTSGTLNNITSDHTIVANFIPTAGIGNVFGWAWSSNVGWISANCAGDASCSASQTYGVNIDALNDFSGYAWNQNIGYISFNRSETGNPPQPPYNTGVGPIAHYDIPSGKVLGWARALSACEATPGVPATSCASSGPGAAAGGWDGWIRFDVPSNGVKIAGNDFSGFGWGADVVGWIDFGATTLGAGWKRVPVLPMAIPTLTITATAGAGGTITPSGVVSVPSGSDKSFVIAPNSGFTIADVKVDGVSVGPLTTYTFNNISVNHTISATFNSSNYTITATAGSGGSISPSGVIPVTAGSSKSFTITPSAMYTISSVIVDGVNVGAAGSYTFTNILTNHTIAANFSLTAGTPASFTSFTFAPATVVVGAASTATWVTANATSVDITCNSGPGAAQTAWTASGLPVSGNKSVTSTVSMVGTTDCTAVANGPGGNSAPMPFTWNVISGAGPATINFTPPPAVFVGSPATASWTTTNATSVEIACTFGPGLAQSSWAESWLAPNSSKTVVAVGGMVGSTNCSAMAIGPGGNSPSVPFTWVVNLGSATCGDSVCTAPAETKFTCPIDCKSIIKQF